MGMFVQNVLGIFETIIFPISPGNFSTNVPNPQVKTIAIDIPEHFQYLQDRRMN